VEPVLAGWVNVAAESSWAPAHVPVLVAEVLTYLAPRPGAVIVDATVGEGGHAEAILRRIAPAGRLIGVDRDTDALRVAGDRLRPFGRNVMLCHGDFGDLDRLLDEIGVGTVDGVLFDVGLSTRQLIDPARGFSFEHVGPLDMRMDRERSETAADLVNALPERELADLIYRYGEERASRRIARQIVARRPLRTTRELVRAVEAAVGGARGRIHPATRTFQALRIATNHELEALERGLPQAIRRLRPGGRVCSIVFHSLEDRIAKHVLAQHARECAVRLLTKKPVRPTAEEVRRNPRARSARLRAAERLGASSVSRDREVPQAACQ
jgi:16S rRNA (cytosine1402-N4)-methyltransferase